MKRIVDDKNLSGLDALLGERVLLLCMNYFYWGKLVGVNKTKVELEDAHIVYETGSWKNASFQDSQALPCKKLYVRISSIEAFCERA